MIRYYPRSNIIVVAAQHDIYDALLIQIVDRYAVVVRYAWAEGDLIFDAPDTQVSIVGCMQIPPLPATRSQHMLILDGTINYYRLEQFVKHIRKLYHAQR